ncbi:hypothetical protein [Undibacterium sp. SXout20W]|uniref:hypothetical protein n=1 Tax=Undibacterium sp. SXout20W TaxID=3413051 RepID=UPI003BF366AE
MLCALIGLVIAISTRVAMISLKLSTILPYQLFVCTAVGLICALVIWIIWFGQ